MCLKLIWRGIEVRLLGQMGIWCFLWVYRWLPVDCASSAKQTKKMVCVCVCVRDKNHTMAINDEDI